MSLPFREKNPIRSTPRKTKADYKDYKPQLKIDFNSRCGYCDSLDSWKVTYYEVDHFVPVTIIKTIKENDYDNLVYSCRSCNNAKRKNWYGSDEKVSHNGKEGFIDPCTQEYADLFYRTKDGDIKYINGNEIAKWIHEKLQLHKQDHALIWKLTLINSLLIELNKIQNLPQEFKEVKYTLLDTFHKYVNTLIEQRE